MVFLLSLFADIFRNSGAHILRESAAWFYCFWSPFRRILTHYVVTWRCCAPGSAIGQWQVGHFNPTVIARAGYVADVGPVVMYRCAHCAGRLNQSINQSMAVTDAGTRVNWNRYWGFPLFHLSVNTVICYRITYDGCRTADRQLVDLQSQISVRAIIPVIFRTSFIIIIIILFAQIQSIKT